MTLRLRAESTRRQGYTQSSLATGAAPMGFTSRHPHRMEAARRERCGPH